MLKVGDTVMMECDSSLGSGGPSKITKITTKYDEDTGKPYKVLWCGDHGFEAKNGRAITTPFAYYIEVKNGKLITALAAYNIQTKK